MKGIDQAQYIRKRFIKDFLEVSAMKIILTTLFYLLQFALFNFSMHIFSAPDAL